MSQLTTTFEKLKEAKACESRYKHLAKSLGGITAYGRNKPITFAQILEHNGIDDVLWAFRAATEVDTAKRIAIEWACACAERSLGNFEKQFPEDAKPKEAVQAAKQYVRGEIDLDKLTAARSAAESAGSAAWSAAESAAESAARSAEKEWQKTKILELITERRPKERKIIKR